MRKGERIANRNSDEDPPMEQLESVLKSTMEGVSSIRHLLAEAIAGFRDGRLAAKEPRDITKDLDSLTRKGKKLMKELSNAKKVDDT